MSIAEENDLIRNAQSGDRRAFATLVERHYKMMFKVAYQWCGLREDAEDIAQDAAIKLAQNIGAFRFESAFSTWMYRLVINTAKDYYKAKNRRNTRELPIYEDVQYVSAEATPEQKMAHKDILRALNSLSEQLKETVILVCWQGLSHKEASQILDCSEGTVSWRVHEARKKIGEFMDEGVKKAKLMVHAIFGLLMAGFSLGQAQGVAGAAEAGPVAAVVKTHE